MGSIINSVCYLWIFLQLVKGTKFECPEKCVCNVLDVSTDCQHTGISELPEELYFEILRLDLAYNNFIKVPTNISSYKTLQYLNMSHNKLSYLDDNSLKGLNSLLVVDLSYNLFADWRDIHKNALTIAPSLLELDFSYNPLRGFPDIIKEHPLTSNSLKTLFLVNCSITNLLGDILSGMINVERLVLARNPLMALNTQIKSEKLHTLDLTMCSLERIHPDTFIELASLEVLLLGKNYQLKKFNSKSRSLRILDLAHCNLDSIPTSRLPNLTKINFKGNHIRRIPANSFELFPMIQVLDLSNNAIDRIDVKSFHSLLAVRSIDLSFNTISSLAPETFGSNSKLIKLDLSRNYLSDIGQLVAESLKWLDLSFCEIRQISIDSLIMMPKLQKLYLSRNLISHIPNRLQADDLQVLDLSRCGIFALNNLTFVGMVRLRSLNLSGNRLTSGIKPSFFTGLTNVQLEDNPWICDCNSDDFRDLHLWLYNVMPSTSLLRCRSPENVAGLTWETACQEIWFSSEYRPPDHMWLYSVLLIAVLSILFCGVTCIRHVYHHKSERQREAQEQEREETRRRLRQIQQRNLQYSMESINRNAPNPLELQTPPSYSEAISMPRLNASTTSLAGSHRSLHSMHSSNPDISRRTKLRRKRRRSRQENKSNVSETQSAASLSHANSNTEVSNSEDDIRQRTENTNLVIESSF